ncbi:MAG: hypothetical protein IJF67_09780 [Clostridia bacterium]|nr:hypothetical protein [Clostridia bacterium]
MTEIFTIPQSAQNLRIVAHRGTTVFAPENTLASFCYAGKRYAWAIETDLRYTRDGAIVCVHNETVDAHWKASGRVCDFTLAELRGMENRAAEAFDYPPEMLHIPTLHEYLAVCLRYGAIPFIEIKDDTVEETVAALRTLDMERRAVISSGSMAHLRRTRELSDDLYIHHIFTNEEAAREMAALGNSGVAWNYPDLDKVPEGLIDRTHAMGLGVCLRAGDTTEAVQRMLAMGLDYIPSNRMYKIL